MVDRRKTKGPQKNPVTAVPYKDFTSKGFGTIQVSKAEWRSRIGATQFTLDVIKNRRLPENSLQMHHCLHMVKDMFRRIHAGDGYDWFSTSRLLGHPSAELCKELTLDLSALRSAIRAEDGILFNTAIDRFQENFGDEMLENYLRMTVNHGHPVREDGWAYVLWSSTYRDILHIGACAGEVDEVLRRLNRENPKQHPYGILAAWLVHDHAAALEDIQSALGQHHLGDGFFRIDFGCAREKLDALLKVTDNFALSPWHEYEPKHARDPIQAEVRKMAG